MLAKLTPVSAMRVLDRLPALDRTRQIDRFAFGEFAVTAAPEVKVPEKKAARSVLIRVHLYSTLEIRQTTTLHIAADQTLAGACRDH